MFRCSYCNKECKNHNSFRNHERLCKVNPERQTTKFTDNTWQKEKATNAWLKAERLGLPRPVRSVLTLEKIRNNSLGRITSLETKQKISHSMKIAHIEGRAGRLNPLDKYKNSNKACKFYILEITKDNKTYIKLGITEREIKARYAVELSNGLSYTELYVKDTDGITAASLEKELLQKYSKYRVKKNLNFIGHTECLYMSCKNKLLKEIKG